MIRIVAFDASTTNVGWCVMDLPGDVLNSGCFSPSGKRAEDRMPAIFDFARGVIRRTVFPKGPYNDWVMTAIPVDDVCEVVVAIEEPRGDPRNQNTNIVLGRAFGVCEAAAYMWRCDAIGVNPQSVKATGCHKHALAVASSLAGHDVGEDEADAIGVALAALGEVKERAWAEEAD